MAVSRPERHRLGSIVLNTRATQNTRSTGVVVLGMHRSGTSLVAGMLARLGFDASGELLATEAQNPKGFWEHAGCVVTHERFLEEIGHHWSDPRPIPEELFGGLQAQKAKDRLRYIYQEDFSSVRCWVLKDPRLCRLLPLWKDVLADVRGDVRFLHVIRDPDAVAESLAVRDDMPRDQSMMLWLRHNVESELFTRGAPRCFVFLDELLSAPVACISTIRRALRLGRIIKKSSIETAVREFLDVSLIHHRAPRGESSALTDIPIVRKAVDGLWRLSEGDDESGQSVLNSVAADLVQMDRLASRPITQYMGESLRVARRSEQVSQTRIYDLTAENARLQSALEQISTHRDQLISHRDELAHQLVAEKERLSMFENQSLVVDAATAEKQEEIDRLEAKNSQLLSDIQGHEKSYAKMNDQLDAACSERAALTEKVRQLVRMIAEAGKHVRAIEDAAANEKLAQQASIDQVGKELERERHSAAQLLSAAKQEMKVLEEKHDRERRRIENSLSWRITWPFRKARSLLSIRRRSTDER